MTLAFRRPVTIEVEYPLGPFQRRFQRQLDGFVFLVRRGVRIFQQSGRQQPTRFEHPDHAMDLKPGVVGLVFPYFGRFGIFDAAEYFVQFGLDKCLTDAKVKHVSPGMSLFRFPLLTQGGLLLEGLRSGEGPVRTGKRSEGIRSW